MKSDPAIDAVRAARHAISERCGHDPKRLMAYYLQRQEALQARLIGTRREAESEVKA